MEILIDIPEHQYNNIMAMSSVNLGRSMYKGVIMSAVHAIQKGTVLPKGHWIINKERDTICCSCCNDKQKIGKDEVELLDTAFTGFRFCRYCGSDNRQVAERWRNELSMSCDF